MTNKRSPAMLKVVERLDEMDRSLSWLGSKLSPRVTRQTVSGWGDVPDHYAGQVAALLGTTAAKVRPDLAALFKPRKRAA